MCLKLEVETGARDSIFSDTANVEAPCFRGPGDLHSPTAFKCPLALVIIGAAAMSVDRVTPRQSCQCPTCFLDQGFTKLGHQDCADSLICGDLSCLYRQRLAKAISLGPNHPGGGPG